MNASAANSPLRRAVLLGLFVGTGIGLGFLFAGVPYLELLTLCTVLAGIALGPGGGFLAGMLAEAAYSLGSPYGAPVPLLLIAQILGMGLAGLAGGFAAPGLARAVARSRIVASGLAAALGAGVAIGFDLPTNLAIAVAFRAAPGPTLVAGAPFAVLHLVVNALVFAFVLPALVPRVLRLRRSALRGISGAVLVCLVLAGGEPAAANPADRDTTAAPAIADTVRGVAADSAPVVAAPPTAAAGPLGWRRPLWTPFGYSLADELRQRGDFLTVADGGVGALELIFDEPVTSPWPQITRDGLPLGTGHRYLDDPTSVAVAGQRVARVDAGLDLRGGMDGQVDLVRDDPEPAVDRLDTRWYAGSHETRYRYLAFQTAKAPWRLGFDFQEEADRLGYDFRVAGDPRWPELDQDLPPNPPGHSRLRSGRGHLERRLSGGQRLAVAVEYVRKLKNALPAYDADHQDLWRQRVDVVWRDSTAVGPLRAGLYWLEADVDWDRPATSGPPRRRLEGGRDGLRFDLGDPWRRGRVTVSGSAWDLADTGPDGDWAGADSAAVTGEGEEGALSVARGWRGSAVQLQATLGGWWDSRAAWAAGGEVRLAESRPRPRWQLTVQRGGRAPRSDEWLTAWRFYGFGEGHMVALPAHDLGRESTWRAEIYLSERLIGLDLDVKLGLRSLRDGIGWRALSDTTAIGRWANDLSQDSRTLRVGLGREGRFLGWIRIRAEATFRGWDRTGEARAALPPEQDWRARVLWENHFFNEDGIVQIAYFIEHRGVMDDPWYIARNVRLPAYTLHDLILGFRLVGTNLSVALRNLTGTEAQLSCGAMAPGRELQWRLHWTFRH